MQTCKHTLVQHPEQEANMKQATGWEAGLLQDSGWAAEFMKHASWEADLCSAGGALWQETQHCEAAGLGAVQAQQQHIFIICRQAACVWTLTCSSAA